MRDEENEAIVVITTVAKESEARELARSLLEKRLAACVQIEEIRSLYRWEGRIEDAGEFRLQIKTLHGLWPRIESLILNSHPYELPELLALPATEMSPEYRRWLQSECREPLKGTSKNTPQKSPDCTQTSSLTLFV
jgi:periplasmic divalent cation tolerance protein